MWCCVFCLLFAEVLDLVGGDGYPLGAPGLAGQACLHGQVGEKLFRPRQLLPHLGQEGGLEIAQAEDDAVHMGSQFGEQVGRIAEGQRLRGLRMEISTLIRASSSALTGLKR